MDTVGSPTEGRVEVTVTVGKPVEAREVLRFPAGNDENPELGRVVRLAFAEFEGKLELGAVIVGKRVVELTEIVGVRLGTEKLVKLNVGAIVGDEATVFERDNEALELGKGGKTLELKEPTMLEPVPTAEVKIGAVVKGGVGTTGTVDVLVIGAGGPCRVRTEVVVPVVTKIKLVVSRVSRPLKVRVYIASMLCIRWVDCLIGTYCEYDRSIING